MFFSLPTQQFKSALSDIERVTPKSPSNPGLSLVLLEAKSDGTITMQGGSIDLDLEVSLKGDVRTAGTVALPTTVFSRVIKSMPDDLITATLSDNELEVKSGSFSSRVQLANRELIPTRAFHDEAYSGQIDAARLVKSLTSVSYAVAIAEYQQIFQGIKFELSDKGTRLIATDGFRLAYYHTRDASGLDTHFVVPGRYINDVVKLLEGQTDVDIAHNDERLFLRSSKKRLALSLMEGTFPDYERIMPAHFLAVITVDAPNLLDVVSRASVMADKSANNRIDLAIENGKIHVTSTGAYGESIETLEVQQEGEKDYLTVSYNARYLLESLNPIKGQARISISGVTSPTVIVEPEKPSYYGLIVPLRTDKDS